MSRVSNANLRTGPPSRANMPDKFLALPGAKPTMTAERVGDEAKNSAKTCAVAGCRGAFAAALEGRPLCLDHFFARCYEALESYDGRRDFARGVPEPERTQLRGFLEECSTQALHVCLRGENLDNLQRSRLLDVLLWAGELAESVRPAKMRSRAGAPREMPAGSSAVKPAC